MNQIEKALRSRIVLVTGDEDLLKRRALEDLLAAADVQPDDLDFEVFDAGSSAPQAWSASAGTAPFLADRRTVVVRRLLNYDLGKAPGDPIGALPESALLILVADEEIGGDERMQKLRTSAKNWEKVVQKAGGSVLAFNSDPKSAVAQLKAEVAKSGTKLSERNLTLLLEMCGGSVSRSLEEFEKLCLYVGGNQAIEERDVRAIVIPSKEWSIFALTDAVTSNRVPEALEQLRVLVGSASKADEAAYRSILPMFSRSLRLLWQAALCNEAGVTPKTAGPEIASCFPERPNLASEPPYRQGQMMSLARKTSLRRVSKALQILNDLDARLKGALPSFSTTDNLERMVLEMAGALAK